MKILKISRAIFCTISLLCFITSPLLAQEVVDEPLGWNDGKRGIARDLIATFDGDIGTLDAVADAAIFANLAWAAYDDPQADFLLAEAGWMRLENFSEERAVVGDLTASLFQGPNGQYVLAFRGSVTGGDWITNVAGTMSPTPLLNGQVADAIKIAEAAKQQYPNIIFTGHSLGGRLAQVSSLKTGNLAYAFNSAPVGFNEIRQMGHAELVSGEMLRFRSPQDQLSGVFTPSDVVVANILEVDANVLFNLVNLRDYTHSMGVLARAMENVRSARDLGWIAAYLDELNQADNPDLPATNDLMTQPIIEAVTLSASPVGGATLDISAGFFDASYPDAWNPPAQHLGTDLPAFDGTQVVSPVSGTVLLNRTDRADAFEKYLIIRSASDGHEHVFGHINSLLSEGDAVEVGTPLGLIVSAGTGPHVHWGINTNGVLESLGSGWGWGRAPLTATVEQAADRGWIDPAIWFAQKSTAIRDFESTETLGWGPTIIPAVGIQLGYRPCGDRTDIRRCLEETGLNKDAIDFSFAVAGDLVGEVFAIDFQEAGEIDVAHVEFNGASPHQWPVLLNGSVGEIALETTSNLAAVFTDPTSQKMLQRFPQATSRSARIRSHRLLQDGTQRFVLVETIINGCRACPILGSAVTFLEIGPATGGVLRRTPIGLSLEDPSNSVDLSSRVLRERPDSLQTMLNILGYNAGEMDGYPGPQTRNALMALQAETCLPTTGQPDSATTNAIMVTNGFEAECSGQSVRPGLSANAPLMSGKYVKDMEQCELEQTPWELLWEQVLVDETRFILGHENPCTTRRTDIRNGITLFRGSCTWADSTQDASWRLDVRSNTEFSFISQQNTFGDLEAATYRLCEATDIAQVEAGHFEPERGTDLRMSILDAVRPIAERYFGPPVEFVVDSMRVLDGQAYVELSAQRPGGGEIDLISTPAAGRREVDFGVGNGNIVSGFLIEQAGEWKPRDIVFQATEAWWVDDCEGLAQLMPETCGEVDRAPVANEQDEPIAGPIEVRTLEGCIPSGSPSFPERMRPVEDSSTHSGRTASGNNWILRLSSPGLDFGDSQFTNSSGTTVDGLWRTTNTGICQSYNGQESWSCHDIFACEGETNRFAMRNSAGEFTSVIEASVGPSYELGAATGPEASSSSSDLFNFGVYATEERFCEIDEAEAVELGDAVGAVNRLIDESGWHRYESVCQPQSYTVNGDIVVMATLCSGEGSQWPSTIEVQRLSPTAFRDDDRTFRLCPTSQEQQAALEVPSAPSDPRVQRQLDDVSPSCRGMDFLGDFFCKEINIREIILDSNLKDATKQEVLSDGRITLDEYHYAWHRDIMTPWGFEPYTRRMWLEMNGYDPNMSGDSWFPDGTMTVAVASRRDTPLPEIVPACDVLPQPSSCSKMGVGLLEEGGDFPGVALYQYIVWRDIPVFDQWLADNGLAGSGVTLFSLVDAGWYTTRSCSACR